MQRAVHCELASVRLRLALLPRFPRRTLRRGRNVSRLRFRISLSLDGYVAGPNQSVENPLGVGGEQLHEWVVSLAAWRAAHGQKGGDVNESSKVFEEEVTNIGATIMGRNMFGGHPGPWK